MEDIGFSLFGVVIALGYLVLVIVIMRFVGAWMFRINEVISQLNKVNDNLNKIMQKMDDEKTLLNKK